ncbi:MAG: hypothetical protein HY000_18365 [Planctomycetes bacterium]|nr:hypothetical protein [Planctomycetota bacterium]
MATKRIAENAVLALRRIEAEKAKRAGEYVEYIEVEGHLKELSELTGKDKIVIADSLTGKKTLCYFRRPDLETKARGAWKHRVSVSGEATVDRSTGELREMEVDELRILRERSELPQMEDLHGIDITGGMESSEYVRGLRDAD